MAEFEDSWHEVAKEFRKLGSAFRDHYEATKETPDEETPTEDEIRDALHTVADALDSAFTAAGEAVKDPEVKQAAKDATRSLVDALAATFSRLGEAVDEAVSSVRKTSQPDTPKPPGRQREHPDIETPEE